MPRSPATAVSLSDPAVSALVESLQRSPLRTTFDQMMTQVEELSRAIVRPDARIERDHLLSFLTTARSALSIVLSRPSPATEEPAPTVDCSSDALMERLVAFVDANIGNTLSNRDLSEAAALSEKSLIAAFRRRFGCPPAVYVRRRRVSRAKALLASTNTTLCDIALQCGFADQAHFTRIFHATTGETPRRWRVKSRAVS